MPIPTGVTQPRSNPQFAPSFDDGDDISIPDRSASKMSWHGGEVFSSNDLLVDVFSRDRNNEEPAPKKFRNNASAREETGNEPQSVSRGRPAGRSLDLNTFLSRSSSDSRKEQKEQREPSPAKETRQVSETQIIGPTPTLSLSELLSSGEIQNVEISIKLQNGKTLKLNGGLTG
jgi:hypothetical protein